jgi:hypothetical protein
LYARTTIAEVPSHRSSASNLIRQRLAFHQLARQSKSLIGHRQVPAPVVLLEMRRIQRHWPVSFVENHDLKAGPGITFAEASDKPNLVSIALPPQVAQPARQDRSVDREKAGDPLHPLIVPHPHDQLPERT